MAVPTVKKTSRKKPASKAVGKKTFIILSSQCGNLDQVEHFSGPHTETVAKKELELLESDDFEGYNAAAAFFLAEVTFVAKPSGVKIEVFEGE